MATVAATILVVTLAVVSCAGPGVSPVPTAGPATPGVTPGATATGTLMPTTSIRFALDWTPNKTPDKMPCVNPSLNIDSCLFTEDMQLRSWALMRSANKIMTTKNWRNVFGNWTAFTNGNGFGDSSDVRADFDSERSGRRQAPAETHEGNRLFRSFLTGKKIGDEIVMTPGIDAIDGNGPIPTVETILNKQWFFYATTARYDVSGTWKVSHFPQGQQGLPVLIPYILREPARYPATWLELWENDSLPDPLRIYR